MSDSDSEFEVVSSQKSSEEFEIVPVDENYTMKVTGTNSCKFKFTLKKGKELPYDTSVCTTKGKGMYMYSS